MKKIVPLCFMLVIASFLSALALADDLKGRVVKIQDGDTITILYKNKVEHRIRLTQIDAPESNQPWGAKSKDYLTKRLAGKTVVVVSAGKDRYKRVLGTVYLSGVNINKELVETGNAWVYGRYATDKSLYAIERQAMKNKVGLWQLPENEKVAPWVWRNANRR